MVELRDFHVGDVVVFTDRDCRDHNALVTVVWDPGCCNLVYISGDEAKTDPYGRQIERDTSVPHVTRSGAPGYCFRHLDEEKPVYRPPAEK